MKIIVRKSFLTGVFVILILNTHAQTNLNVQSSDALKHSFSFGYGTVTSLAMAYATASYMSSLLPGPLNVLMIHYDTKFSGAYFLSYHYSLSPRLRLGATFAYEKSTTNDHASSYTYTGQYYSILAGAKYLYNPNRKVNLYGRADLGLLIYSSGGSASATSSFQISPSSLAFQISPICIRIGKRIGAYCELGFGNIGLINLGADCRF